MQLRKWQMIGSLLALVIAVVWIITNKQKPNRDEVTQLQGEQHRSASRETGSVTAPQPAKSTNTAQSLPSSRESTTPPQEVDQIVDGLHKAAITYDSAELPKIEPYLLHPNREIREAALDAMITIGDASAGPLLRNAATRAPSPQEAVALIEAADFVELPPALLKFKKKK